jgi:fatty-acyl-CoA synthase
MSLVYTTDWFKRWAMYSPKKIALREYETGETASYEALNNYSNQLTFRATTEWKLGFGDRIAVLAENSIALVAFLGLAQKTGIIIAPLNYRLTPLEIDDLLDTLQPAAIFYDKKFEKKLQNTKGLANVKLAESIESIYADLKGSKKIAIPKETQIPADHPAFIIFTSGTTGKPKGSQYTHGMMFWNSINTQLRLDLSSNDRSINCAPSFHTGGWNVLLTPFIHHGAYTLLMKGFDASKVLELIERDSVTIWWAVPTMLKLMVQTENFEEVSLSQLRYLVVGGEAMPIPLIEKWAEKNIPIRQGYGLTEVGPNVMSLNEEHAILKKGSIGLPNFYYEIRIVNEQNDDCEDNKPGELWLSGPAVSPGYYNNEEATRENMEGKWFKTGDVVLRDKDGFLYVVDRLKYMYISGGENVYPAEVEKQMLKIKGIADIAITGVKDEKWGETGKAFVVVKQNYKLSVDDILLQAEDLMAKYKIPKHYVFVEDLPKNDAGKIDRKQLKIMALNP